MADKSRQKNMTLIDFCHWSLRSSVTCDKISTDGYEVENLISPDQWKKRNGYMAERFIKVPINITFFFPCPVSIWRIIIDPVVGSQKSSAIGIYTTQTGISPRNQNKKSLIKNNTEKITAGTSNQTDVKVQTVSQFKKSEMCVGRISMTTPGKLCFYDPHFQSHKCFSKHEFRPIESYDFACELRHIKQIYTANHITLKIYQTFSGSVGAIKHVEIWGAPAACCPKNLQIQIYEKYYEGINKQNDDMPIASNSCSNGEQIPNVNLFPEKRKITDIQIPEEFTDALCCEIMAVPMLLPCGRNIDKSTLDRFISEEATWGRQPNDPFTGVAFSSNSFPVPNDSLKSRIDHFLMANENSVYLQSVPRTVSTLYQRHMSLKRKHDETKNSEILTKQPKLISIEKEDNSIIRVSSNDQFNDKISNTNVCDGEELNDGEGQSHEDSLRNSLDSSLANVLCNFPSFHKTKTVLDSGTSVCSICKSNCDTNSIKYQLTCFHVICRTCLMQNSSFSEIQCQNCGKVTQKKLIKRIHV